MPSSLPIQPEPTVHDEIPYPQRRRVIWEHGMDMALAFRWLLVVTVFTAVALCFESFVLITIYLRPPVVLDQNEGYLMWRTTEAYKLSPDMIRTYLESTLKYMQTVNPGDYNLAPMTPFVDKRLLKAFSELMSKDLIVSANQRRVYEIREIRRYRDPKLPKLLALAVRGEKVLYEFDPAAAQPFRLDTQEVTQVVYLKQPLPTPSNPWGLVMVGLVNLKDAQVNDVWNASAPLEKETANSAPTQ